MNTRTRIFLLAGSALLIGLCIFGAPLIMPSFIGETEPTPTPVGPSSSLVDITPTELVIAMTEPQVIAAPPLPSPFDIMLNFTNGTCGGGDATYAYTVTINGIVMTIVQTDANITTTGNYDPASGEFNTSADVGPGVEVYTGVIVYDGQTILMGGVYGWNPDSGSPCGADIEGSATP